MKVLVTGANGFVGRHLCQSLAAAKIPFAAVVRRGKQAPAGVAGCYEIDGIGAATDWTPALQGATHVVHLASLGNVAVGADVYNEVNYEGSVRLARQAQACGVGRMIFLSTVAVYGEVSARPLTTADATAPLSDYARSKEAAEKALLELAGKTGMAVTVIRSPHVYGPGGSGNVALLARAVRGHWPLPFASIRNLRSLVNVFNLCSFIRTCLNHPAAKNAVALVSDGDDVSTPELVRRIAAVLQCRAHLFPCRPGLLKAALTLAGQSVFYPKLCCNMQVDISTHRAVFGWSPEVSMERAFALSFR